MILLFHLKAGYILYVKVHSYNNPTNKCPGCFRFRMPGCCDDFTYTGTCHGSDKCDENFFYCLREFGTTSLTDPSKPTRCGENDAFGKLSGDNIDSADIDFSGSTALGLPNPIPLRNNTSGWEVSTFKLSEIKPPLIT